MKRFANGKRMADETRKRRRAQKHRLNNPRSNRVKNLICTLTGHRWDPVLYNGVEYKKICTRCGAVKAVKPKKVRR